MQRISENKKISITSEPWLMHEFFAGSGLVAYGLRGMFDSIWANDISAQKAAVYEANLGLDHFRLGDIRQVQGAELPYAHLSWASFPCQDLSLAGTLGGIHGSRSGLVWEWLRVLREMENKPRVLTLENVMGLLSADNGNNYRTLHSALVELGYDCGAIVLNASHFVPQSRQRVFVIAVRHGYALPPEIIGNGPCWLHNKAAITLGKSLPGWIWWKTEKPQRRQISLKDVIDENVPFDKDYVLKLVPEKHKTKLDGYESVYATGYRRTRNGKQQLELRCDGIAGCLRTPEGGSSKQYVVVKKKGKAHARLLTVREAARLMGAPDSFVLPGSYNDGYKAMGDAVAMPVVQFLGERFLNKIAEAVYTMNTEERLKRFQTENKIFTKGALSVVVQITRLVRDREFPLNPEDFKTEKEGQVAGLGGGNLKKILKEHGITQILASEGGRTSRGSMGLMIKYIEFLNNWNDIEAVNISEVETFWAERVKDFFRNQPFVLIADSSRTIGANIDDLFEQAKKRQKQNTGTQYLGTVLQHLVAAKLRMIMPEKSFEIHGASVADAPTERNGDFVLNNTVIHCTTMPGTSLIDKCKSNLRGDYHPIIITIYERVQTALSLTEDAGLDGRIEVWDVKQFLSANVYEHSLFDERERNSTLADIVRNYNDIVLENETDPSLRIEFETRESNKKE